MRDRSRGLVAHLVRSPVRIRVTIAAALVSLAAGLIGSVFFVTMIRKNLEQSVQTSAVQQAQALVAQLRNGATPRQAAISGQDDVVTQVVDADGHIVAGDYASRDHPLALRPGVTEGVRVSGAADSFAVSSMRTSDGGLVVVGRSEEHVDEASETATTLLLIGVPLGVLLLTVVVWISIGRALRPVEAMRRQAQAITSEHLHRRLSVPQGSDEIAHLSSTLNEMLDGIDSAQQLQRQFIADASHELRSPLASMRQVMEVAAHYPQTMSAQELALDVLPEEQRMEELVSALLTLARLDDDVMRPARTVVDLDEIVLAEVSRARRDAQGPKVHVARMDAVQVRGNAVLLAQAVRNLLSNAVRHGVSRVDVSLVDDESRVGLVVEDDGNGIPPDQREKIFERFVRLDEARNRDQGGSGLGLAIVRKVVSVAGGEVVVDDSDLGGARFTVSLSAA
jgi:signal transduction histidine kinase